MKRLLPKRSSYYLDLKAYVKRRIKRTGLAWKIVEAYQYGYNERALITSCCGDRIRLWYSPYEGWRKS
jgi:hypothetical protein